MEKHEAIELMKAFADYTGEHFTKCHGGWYPLYGAQTMKTFLTTEQLLLRFAQQRKAISDMAVNMIKDYKPEEPLC